MEKLNGGGALLAWLTTAASPQITMEIHISDWTHKFHNKPGLDAKANSELYKSNRVNSVGKKPGSGLELEPGYGLDPDPGSGLNLDPGSGLDPDPDPYQMNTDPKPCKAQHSISPE